MTYLLIIVLLLQLIAPHATNSNPHRILCFGDSLTQGVGKYVSYRRHLQHLLRASFPTLQLSFLGSRNGSCVAGHPANFAPLYHKDFDPRHEGYCNWGTDRLAAKQTEILKQIPQHSIDSVLFLAGHNDVFAMARTCKLSELQGGRNNPDCVNKYIQDKTEGNIITMLKRFCAHSPHVQLYIGLNPPTGFSFPTQQLHKLLKGAVLTSLSGAVCQNEPVLVNFNGFTKGVHTWDTTHPNEEGEKLMATSWYNEMKNKLHNVRNEIQQQTPPPPSTVKAKVITLKVPLYPEDNSQVQSVFTSSSSTEDVYASTALVGGSGSGVEGMYVYFFIFGLLVALPYAGWKIMQKF